MDKFNQLEFFVTKEVATAASFQLPETNYLVEKEYEVLTSIEPAIDCIAEVVVQRETLVSSEQGPRGPQGKPGPIGPPGTDVGSVPTISRESDELFPLKKGQPVSIVNGKLKLAKAIPPLSSVVGLVFDDEIIVGGTGRVQISGTMTQTPLAWEEALGIVGGLSQESVYYLSEVGGMSPWPPTEGGLTVSPVGKAASPSEFIIDIDTEVHL